MDGCVICVADGRRVVGMFDGATMPSFKESATMRRSSQRLCWSHDHNRSCERSNERKQTSFTSFL